MPNRSARICSLQRCVLGLALIAAITAAGAQPLHDCAKAADSACVQRTLASGTELDALDDRGRTALYLAAEAVVESRSLNEAKRAADVLIFLRSQGASWDLAPASALLRLRSKLPAARRALEAINSPNNHSKWQGAMQDERFRMELGLTRDNFMRARDNVDLLKRSGRFIDYYVAYAVTRDTQYAKAAQGIISSKSERIALEHMAILTVPDPGELLAVSVTTESNSLPRREASGGDYFLLSDLQSGKELTGWVRLRPSPDSRVPLIHGDYRVQTDLQLDVAPLPNGQPDWDNAVPLNVPLYIDIRSSAFIGAVFIQLSALSSLITEKGQALGTDFAIRHKMTTVVRKFDRLKEKP